MAAARTVEDALVRAKGLLAKGWTKGVAARNAEGEQVATRSPKAVQWCAVGALDRATGTHRQAWRIYAAAVDILDQAAAPWETIVTLNDRSHSVKPVLRAFDKAIQLCSGKSEISEGRR